MKQNFDFTLTGKKFLPLWILIYVIVGVPYLVSFSLLSKSGGETSSILPIIGLYTSLLIGLVLTYFVAKLFINSITLEGEALVFEGKFGSFIGKILLGVVLSIVTLTIYMPWFIRDIQKYFAQHTKFKGQPFDFAGKGWVLLILLLIIYIPAFLFGYLSATHMDTSSGGNPILWVVISQLVFFILIIPFYYFMYKWMVDFTYKDYSIKWETKFWNSIGKIFIEIFLSLVSMGIYAPFAYLRLYQYFVNRTVAYDTEGIVKKRFSYAFDPIPSFLLIWGQTLLTLITLGLYYPWMVAKVGRKLIGQTSIEDVEA